jgi:hypothetical protein
MNSLDAILSAAASEALLLKTGYSAEEVADLHGSGVAAVDLGTISEMQAFEILGSNPINLFSPDADWNEWGQRSAPERMVLVDFYSGAVFRPMELRPFAMFGRHGLGVPFPSDFPGVSSHYRWRFNDVPVFTAWTGRDLQNLEERLNRLWPNYQILFRGQTQQYTVPRGPATLRLLYGDAAVSEPSLLSTAFRERFPYVSTERHIRAIIADIDYRLTGFKDHRWWVEDRYETVYVADEGMIARWHRISTMAIAQHYGIPTYGLDVTTSMTTAWWFATHDYHARDEKASFHPHAWSGSDFRKWPAIFVLRTASGEYIGQLDLPATRPRHQHAVFARGGWGPHGNICADDLIAVIVLAPEVGLPSLETNDVVPQPGCDPMYDELLRLKARLTRAHPLYAAAGLRYVFDLTPA